HRFPDSVSVNPVPPRAQEKPMTTLPEILSTLFHPDEIVSLCSLPPGGRLAPWRAPRDAVAAAAAQGLPDSSNFWFGPNPVRGDIPAERRENEREVTRLGTLSADLDVKPGVFETLDDAYKATARISQLIGSDPVFVIRSGHGLAPIWQIDPDDSDARINSLDDTRRMVSIARRFSRLVAAVTDD